MGLIRVELRCLEDKIAIMKNKNKLQGTDRKRVEKVKAIIQKQKTT